ncbi:hypothetical protein LshimejAT787_0111600 [Lyophyllum shimeji]|uniref:Transmembrane protein n=1 Tax=Lyophyllum shimeji TaxID=47721 RepID=A0A9P3PF11_LYOSH|nr:hypothetical protein LshimejAT787_0111600 [Lyophyllum shimeji]
MSSLLQSQSELAASGQPPVAPSRVLVPQLVPSTPPAKPLTHKKTRGDHVNRQGLGLPVDPVSRVTLDHDDSELAVPDRSSSGYHAACGPVPKTQPQILTALAVGAPLIASVVSSCTSVISADFTAALGNDPSGRPAKASIAVTFLWCALVTSLGSTMIAVSGLALHAGYHDSHVGMTKRIVRHLRRWRDELRAAKGGRQSQAAGQDVDVGSSMRLEARPHSPAVGAMTDDLTEQQLHASFCAAVIAARLLGLSIALLGGGIAVYLFVLYPVFVAAIAVAVGIATAAAAATALFPLLMPRGH